MRIIKKVLPVCLLAVVLMVTVTLLTPKAQAASSGTCGENVTWTLDDAGTLTISGTGPMTNYNWDKSPWYNNSLVKAVVIRDGVTTVANSAFNNCVELKSVIIADSVTTIGCFSFVDCYFLENVTIGSGVVNIDISAFAYCYRLRNVVLPEGVTSIGNYAFEECQSMREIFIPQSVTKIGKAAFSNCQNLQNVYYGGTENQWKSISMDNYNSSLTDATVHFNQSQNNVISGDFTEDKKTDNDDVVLLLWHTLFPAECPLNISGDINGDGDVNNDDVVLLLWHTLFPEDYPL